MVHISELSNGYVGSVNDICRVGDTMLVKVIAVDDQDRVKLSRKAALAEKGIDDPNASNSRPSGGGGGGDRPPMGMGGDRPPMGGGGAGDRGGPPRRGPGGPRRD